MLAWADHQQANGMIQESLSLGCLEETSKEGTTIWNLLEPCISFVKECFLGVDFGIRIQCLIYMYSKHICALSNTN